MELILAVAALAAAVGALLLAFRCRASARRLALEMVQLRDRLARAERHYRDRGGPGGGPDGPDEAAGREVLQVRLVELEERLRDALARSADANVAAAAVEHGEGDNRGRILQYLRSEGYDRVAFLGPAGAGAWLVEAERGGVVSKGRAEVAQDGSVRLRSVSSVRAFP